MNGLRVGVTGARKAAQLAGALERRGAVPVLGPLVGTDQPAPDEEILTATEAVVAARPAWLAASTGVGMRPWAEVARRHGRDEELRAVLADTRAIARGAKAVAGLAAFDLSPAHVTEDETDEAVTTWLLEHASAGDAVAVQLHGGLDTAYDRLADARLELHPVRPYVAGLLPDDEERARALIRQIVESRVDVVTFTSPAAARNLYDLAASMGPTTAAGLDEAVGHQVAVAVIGPVTAEVFAQRGVPIAVAPERHRQGELVRALDRWAASRS